jgi:hypothetical protein
MAFPLPASPHETDLCDSLHFVLFPAAAVAGAVLGSTSWETRCAINLISVRVWKWGCEMVILKKGDCEHCGRFYRYSLWHSGFGDNSYAYCDECGMLALLSYSNEDVAALPPIAEQFGEIDSSWESYLQPCACGGSFRKGASPRCPFCNGELSPTHAADHIEAQAMGARGWNWQNNWSGLYCIAMDNSQNPGTLLQVTNPVLSTKPVKVRRRWPVLFSFSR